MILCPNCGTANEPGSRFCAECGADLRSLASTQPQPVAAPPQAVPAYPSPPSQSTGWQPANTPPPEAPQRRRTWLWVVVGVIGACVLLCCGVGAWASSDSGQNFFEDFGTEVTDYLTEEADTPTPDRTPQ